jgi:hypothetical protein
MPKTETQPQAKASQDVYLKMLIENLEQMSRELGFFLQLAEANPPRYKTVRGFQKALDKTLRERLNNIDANIAALKGKNKVVQLDAEIIGGTYELKEIRDFIGYVKELCSSDISTEYNALLADGLLENAKWAAQKWNEFVNQFDETFIGHELKPIYGMDD